MLHRIILAHRLSKLTHIPVDVTTSRYFLLIKSWTWTLVRVVMDKVAVTAQQNLSVLSDTGNDKPLTQLSGFGRGTPHYCHDGSRRNSLSADIAMSQAVIGRRRRWRLDMRIREFKLSPRTMFYLAVLKLLHSIETRLVTEAIVISCCWYLANNSNKIAIFRIKKRQREASTNLLQTCGEQK